MIIDKLSHLKNYFALHPRIAIAARFIEEQLTKISDGKHIIDGDKIFVTIGREPLKELYRAQLESHQKYIDIHITLSGREQIGWRATDECHNITLDYDKKRDITFFSDEIDKHFFVNKGQFAIFMPQDAHAPLIGQGFVRKAVVKILID